MGLGFLIALRIPEGARLETGQQSDARAFLASRHWLVFLAVAFCGGMALSVISNFLFLFLRELGANELSLGFTLTVATLSELPVLFFSNQLLRRWSAQRLISMALVLFAIRALAYSLITTPWLALLIQLMHGPTFSLMWVAGVSYADKIAPSSLEATAQGLFAGAMLGLGSAAGAFVGGLAYQYAGPVVMFRIAALIALVSAGFILRMDKKNHEYSSV
jgi:PPP family 3-phenylpropionic acid transporter